MGLLIVLIAQASAAPTAPPPDIEIRARAEVRSLDVRSQGRASLVMHADPGEAPPVKVERSAPAGRSSYQNLTIDIHAIARLTGPEPIAALNTKTGNSE